MRSETLRSGRMFSFVTIAVIFLLPRFSFGNIDEHLNYYETLHHDTFRHHIVRKDLYTKNPTERLVEFDSHGKHFKLVLHKHTSILASDFEVTVVDGNSHKSLKFDPAIYRGYLEDEPTTSSVSAYWNDDNNEFTASISTASDVFTVEPSWRHLPASSDYNLISYKGSDMKQLETSEPRTCSAAANEGENDRYEGNVRKKRNDGSLSHTFPNKICQVRLVADYRFYEKIGHRNKFETSRYLVVLMDLVDNLFRNQTFGKCGKGFGFEVKDITIHLHPSEKEYHYNSNAKWEKAEDILEAFTHNDSAINSEFCLAHLFTAVSFNTGVFGIAYVGDPSQHKTNNGICPDVTKVSINNTGWTTFVDRDNRPIPTLQAQLVTAHEFGHGWGSNHDVLSSSLCAPNDINGGKYIMFSSAVNGIQPNNRNFSSCSKSLICQTLIARAKKCFKAESPKRCGNYIREDGEICDEGLTYKCCTDKCGLKDTANCSDWNDECCVNCQFANSSKQCHHTSDKPCTEDAYCTGDSANCSIPEAKDDRTVCLTDARGSGLCHNKVCISLCESNNMTTCLCDEDKYSCKVCCRNATNGTCQQFFNETGQLVDAPDNTHCLRGFCVNGVCQNITDASLMRPWFYINFQSVAQFVKFMKNNIVGSVIVISLLFWIPASCGVSYIDRKRAKAAGSDLETDWQHVIMSHLNLSQNENTATIIKMKSGTVDMRNIRKK